MGGPMEPTVQSPPPTPTATLPFLSKNALDTSHAEILVLASGILFLASQVCLLVWLLRRTGAARAAPPHGKEHRKVAIVLPPTPDAHDEAAMLTTSGSNGNDEPSLRLRRRSSWGGSSVAHPGPPDPQDRRRSVGSPGRALDSDDDDDAGELTQLRGNIGRRYHLGADLPATGPPATERGSPRSPRVLAADQAAMMDALCAEGEKHEEGWTADVPSPVVGAEVDAPALAFGFEDPLGVNRLVDLLGKDGEGHEAVELEARDGERRDARV